ncbi:hypothetical protein [Streptomyces sp. NPDC014733]|uniref:hypothetical protein n=1 Tax=Streptomyces sp. NPDC014733 TaxID=3364885 RepID=UPI0037020AFE
MPTLFKKAAAAVAVTAGLLSASAAATPAVAATAGGVHTANVLNCTTYTEGSHLAIADCTNNTNQRVAFRVTAVCGWAPDGKGNWVSLDPGQRGKSGFPCGGTGVGSASWEEG